MSDECVCLLSSVLAPNQRHTLSRITIQRKFSRPFSNQKNSSTKLAIAPLWAGGGDGDDKIALTVCPLTSCAVSITQLRLCVSSNVIFRSNFFSNIAI